MENDIYLKTYYNPKLNLLGLGVYYVQRDGGSLVWMLETKDGFIELDPDGSWLDGWEYIGDLVNV